MIRTMQQNIQPACRAQETILEAKVVAGNDPEAPIYLVILQNEIAQGEFDENEEVPIQLNDSEKTQSSNDWCTYQEWSSTLLKHQGQVYSLILGQCTQLLQDKMKQDTDWTAVSTLYDPLTLF